MALSPLHAPTPVAPIPASPYYPSSRRWRSPLLIRVDEVGRSDRAARGARRRRAPRSSPIRSCGATSAGRASAPRSSTSGRGSATDERARAPTAGGATQGDELERWATFCALAEVHGPELAAVAGRRCATPTSPAVARAAADLADRVAFHAWLQQLVDEQLGAAGSSGVRLVQDLAVGVDPDGADAWTWQDLLADGFSIGAPPDEFETDGPVVGAAAVDPVAAARRGLPAARRPAPRRDGRAAAGCASTT